MSSADIEKYHIERIREVLTLSPKAGRITIREILKKDAKEPIILHEHYIAKLKRKIETERAKRYDYAIVGKRLAEIQDRTESLITQMWRIVLDQTEDGRARVGAAKLIIDADHRFLEAQMSAGIFERKLGTLEVDHQHYLPPEHLVLIKKVFQNYGIIAPAIIEQNPDGNGSRALIEQPAHAAGDH